MKSVRWDFSNADTLCKLPCHSGRHQSSLGWEYQKQVAGEHGNKYDGAYTAFKKKQLGNTGFDLLMVRAHTPTKIDEKILRQAFKIEWARMIKEKKSKILGAR